MHEFKELTGEYAYCICGTWSISTNPDMLFEQGVAAFQEHINELAAEAERFKLDPRFRIDPRVARRPMR